VLVPGGRICCVIGDILIPRRADGRHRVLPLPADLQVRSRTHGLDNLTPILWFKIGNRTNEAGGGSSGYYGKPYQPGAIIKNDTEHILMLRKAGGNENCAAMVLPMTPEHPARNTASIRRSCAKDCSYADISKIHRSITDTVYIGSTNSRISDGLWTFPIRNAGPRDGNYPVDKASLAWHNRLVNGKLLRCQAIYKIRSFTTKTKPARGSKRGSGPMARSVPIVARPRT
jgi:hypothetical protein